MKSIMLTIVGVALLAGGCRSVEFPSRTRAAAMGPSVQLVIDASYGLRMEIFDEEGKPVNELPRKQRGSVSIHSKDQTGQDNFAFDEDGVIVKHLRSYGTNYIQGVWEEVK